jgi:alpha-L-fucosidase
MNRIPSLFFVLLLAACQKPAATPPAPVAPVPTAAQLAWHEMETNAFIHFTINTFTDKEWGYGDEQPARFAPTAVNTDQWISTLKEAGFKGVILTCKHHDGFCLWPSAYTEHSIKHSPYKDGKGDLVKEVSDACKAHGLKFGVYASPWDRNHADYGKPEYITYYRDQLKELFSQYGPVFEMWFDGANGGDGFYGGANEKRQIDRQKYYDWPGTLNMVREMEPNILFFSDAGPDIRWVGNERGEAGETNWNSITPDTLYAGKADIENLLQTGNAQGTRWIPAEVDVSIRPGWFYHSKEDSLVKTPERLFEIYLSSVGRGSTLLLNVPPDGRGLIHENDVKSLQGWRRLIDSTFAHNLATGATATASHYRGESEAYDAVKAIDGQKDTYWATDDGITAADLEITLDTPQRVQYILLQEYIALGQRVEQFEVEVWQGNAWKKVASATTIGYKRIVKLEPVETSKVRVKIIAAKACPLISQIGLY